MIGPPNQTPFSSVFEFRSELKMRMDSSKFYPRNPANVQHAFQLLNRGKHLVEATDIWPINELARKCGLILGKEDHIKNHQELYKLIVTIFDEVVKKSYLPSVSLDSHKVKEEPHTRPQEVNASLSIGTEQTITEVLPLKEKIDTHDNSTLNISPKFLPIKKYKKSKKQIKKKRGVERF